MKYAPVLIKTLCRYSKFKQCLESLAANSWAEYTTVYIALDYPFKEEHWEGYEKIKNFLMGKFNFKKLVILKREKNFGPYRNGIEAKKEIYRKFDRIISSEDDNVFSPNFLEYMNKCLERYEFDEQVVAVCGYIYPKNLFFDKNTVFKNDSFYNAWGSGRWRDKNVVMSKILHDESFYKGLLSWNRMIPLLFKKPKIFYYIMMYNSVDVWPNDCTVSVYLSVQKKFIIRPVISKVRNIGNDEEGTTAKHYYKYYKDTKTEYIDTKHSFELLEDESFSKKNDKLFNKIGNRPYHTIKRLFVLKQFIRFLLYKIFGYNLRKRINVYNEYLYGALENMVEK